MTAAAVEALAATRRTCSQTRAGAASGVATARTAACRLDISSAAAIPLPARPDAEAARPPPVGTS